MYISYQLGNREPAEMSSLKGQQEHDRLHEQQLPRSTQRYLEQLSELNFLILFELASIDHTSGL